jgi:2-haloacid dehalogenase
MARLFVHQRPGVVDPMRALAFDVFGTLFDLEAVAEVARSLVERAEEFISLWRSKQLEYTFLLALMGRFMTFSDVTRRALLYANERLEADLGRQDLETLAAAWRDLRLHGDVPSALEKLREEYTMVVLSNGEKGLLHTLLERVGVRRMFSQVLSAEEVRTYKPSPRVYQLAATRLGLPCGEIGLVSSNAFDILGAKAAGMRALWVNRSGVALDPVDLEPDIEVRNFEELLERLTAR